MLIAFIAFKLIKLISKIYLKLIISLVRPIIIL